MGDHADALMNLRTVDGVAVASVLDEEIRQPAAAADLGEALNRLADDGDHRRILIDLSRTRYLCSSGFAVLLNFARKVETAGGTVKICGLHPDVEVGANIIGLGRIVEVHADTTAALASF